MNVTNKVSTINTEVDWRVECKVYFIPDKVKRTKSGKPVMICVESRKLLVIDSNAITDSGDYRIVLRRDRYTVSVIPRQATQWWISSTRKTEWVKTPDSILEDGTIIRPFVRTNDPPMNRQAMTKWLACRFGKARAVVMLDALDTAEPE